MYSAAIKRNKVSSKPNPNASQQRTSDNNASGTGMIVSVSGGGYKILCFVVGLAVITFVSSIWTLNHYSYSLNSSKKYSSLSSSRHSVIAEYMVTTFENIPTLFALQIAQFTTNITSKNFDFKTTSFFSSTPSNDPASHSPSKNPTVNPSSSKPTHYPSSNVPTIEPTSNIPTSIPTLEPSSSLPTHDPSTNIPTIEPTSNLPTHKPSTNIPTLKPSSNMPTLDISSNAPTLDPSAKKLLLLAYHPQIPPSTLNNFASLLSTERSTQQIGRTTFMQNNISLQGSSFGTVANASAIGSSINRNQSSLSVFRTIEDTKLLVENVELLTSIDAYFLDSVATLDGSSKIGSLLPLELGPKNSSMRKDPSRVLENVRGNVTNDMRRCNESFPSLCPNNEEMYSYVRFWNQRFSKHDCYESPLRFKEGVQRPEEEKFLVFEPDRGGWNNIRMAAETAMIFAHASGRTLVLPPEEKWYLLDKNPKSEENIATFKMFFDLRKVSEAMRIISMEEFVEKVAMKGRLKIPVPSRFSDAKAFIGRPGSAHWENSNSIYKYLEQACFTQKWNPYRTFVGFNLTSDGGFGSIEPGSDPRYAEMVKAGRRKMFQYNQTLHNERCLFFPGDYRDDYRLLVHYYAYIYWADVHISRIYRRIVRDRLHYHDTIFCAAGRIVRAIHEDAANLSINAAVNSTRIKVKQVQPMSLYNRKTLGGNTNMNATYYAFHIRRGDFQYKETKLSAERIWANARPLLDPAVSNLIYIATDESDKGFFAPFSASGEFTVRFLRDYTSDNRRFVDNLNHVGMVEQIICANAHTFIGTPFSTFTGYITRMRGYYRDGRYDRTYYTMQNYMYQLQREHAMREPFWAREFEIAHKNIDDYY